MTARALPSPSQARLLALALAAAAGLGAGCGTPRPTAAGGALTGGWVDLTDPRHWRSDGGDAFPSGWALEDDALTRTADGVGGDLVSRETYGDFELALEWRVAPCGNSGIFYRGAEGGEAIYNTAPEMQVLDNTCHSDAEVPSHTAGAAYDLYVPTADATRPAGEWNEVRILARGAHVEHWLNGVTIVEFEQGSAEWNARVAASKFVDEPGFGTYMDGLIGLQDHGDLIAFRRIRIRRLD